MAVVYLIHNTLNGWCYVGVTKVGLEKRWQGHVKSAKYYENRRSKKSRRAYRCSWNRNRFRNAVCKHLHELDVFDRFIVSTHDSLDEAYLVEIEFIAYCRSIGMSLYNIHPGGNGGTEWDDRRRQAVRSAPRKSCPQEMRERISKTLTGRKLAPEHRVKVIAAIQTPESHANATKTLRSIWASPEFRAKKARQTRAAYVRDPLLRERTKHLGVKNGRVLVTEHDVVDIRADWVNVGLDVMTRRQRYGKAARFCEKWAQRLGVSPATVKAIVVRKTWKHLP